MGTAFWIRRFVTVFVGAFGLIAASHLVRGRGLEYALVEAGLWAPITACVFTAARLYQSRRGSIAPSVVTRQSRGGAGRWPELIFREPIERSLLQCGHERQGDRSRHDGGLHVKARHAYPLLFLVPSCLARWASLPPSFRCHPPPARRPRFCGSPSLPSSVLPATSSASAQGSTTSAAEPKPGTSAD